MNLKKILEEIGNDLVNTLNSTGVGGIYERYRRFSFDQGRGCDPEIKSDPCNVLLARESTYVSLAMAWADYAIRWIPKFPSLVNSLWTRWLTYFPSLWNVLSDILVMWNFFLQMFLAIYSEAYSPRMEDKMFNGTIVGMLLLAVISNSKLRSLWREWRYGNEEIGWMSIFLDGFFELMRGAANTRAVIFTCEAIHDSLWSVSKGVYSLAGMLARYIPSGVMGLLTGYVGLKYGPNIDTENLFSTGVRKLITKISNLFSGLFPPITFILKMALTMKDISPSRERNGFIAGFSSLVPVIFLRACCCIEQPLVQGQQRRIDGEDRGDNDRNQNEYKALDTTIPINEEKVTTSNSLTTIPISSPRLRKSPSSTLTDKYNSKDNKDKESILNSKEKNNNYGSFFWQLPGKALGAVVSAFSGCRNRCVRG